MQERKCEDQLAKVVRTRSESCGATDERLNRIRVKGNKALGLPNHPQIAAVMEKAELTEEEVNAFVAEETAWSHFRAHTCSRVRQRIR